MEKKESMEPENSIELSTFPTNYYPSSSIFDMCEDEKGSLGFMDLLGFHDFNHSIFDLLQPPSVATPPPTTTTTCLLPESSEVLNFPTTPNSSSSIEATANDEQTKAAEEEDEQENTKNQSKPKNKNKKRTREPRFAFMTKSEVDHLEDGYRWRKYGQKAVKNSPFARSYYRCTNATCSVKKRVERSSEDSTIVVTTYEGQHTHPSPIMPRGSHAILPQVSGSFGAVDAATATASFATSMQMTQTHYQQHQQQPYFHSLIPLSNFGSSTSVSSSLPTFLHERRFCTSSATSLLRDHGLLQDIVPSDMRKEE